MKLKCGFWKIGVGSDGVSYQRNSGFKAMNMEN